MYSERYWLINALSAHNPLGSVKGTGEKTCSFSHYVFSPLPVIQKTSFFFFCWQYLRDKSLNICQVMHSKEHWSSWVSVQLLWKAWQGIALTLALCSSWPQNSMLFTGFTYCKISILHQKAWKRFTVFFTSPRKWGVYFEHTVASPKQCHLPLLIAVTVSAVHLWSGKSPQIQWQQGDLFSTLSFYWADLFLIHWLNQSKYFFPKFFSTFSG